MKKILSTLKEKWTEYLIEVTVIVLGIWGAFALESWNEDNAKHELEIKILREIQSNIIKDFDDHNGNLFHLNKMQNGSNHLLDFMNGKESWNDSLAIHIGNLMLFPDFSPVKSGYELMAANPEARIQNDSIRKNISYLYGSSYFWVEKRIAYNQENATKYYNDIVVQLFDDFYYTKIDLSKNIGNNSPSGFNLKGLPHDKKALQSNKQLRSVILYYRAQINFFITHYKRRLKLAYIIIDQLEDEINYLESI